MGRKIRQNVKLLENSFSRPEWEYLKRHPQFKARLEASNLNLNDFDDLCLLGGRLLRQWETDHPENPKFRRVGAKKEAPALKGKAVVKQELRQYRSDVKRDESRSNSQFA